MAEQKGFQPIIAYTDTGGTFTDTFIMDKNGDFVIGKASTTPKDVSIGYFDSMDAAVKTAKGNLKEVVSQLEVCGYGSTTAINTLVTRTGAKLGMIITKGCEDYLIMERGFGRWANYSYEDGFHVVTHKQNTPLIHKSKIKGVTERIGCLGDVVIPIYEKEVAQGVEELLKGGVEGIIICFLWSYLNEKHEKKAEEIALKVMSKVGKEVPVYLSSVIAPVFKEYNRFWSTLVEGYAAAPARAPLLKINKRLGELGFKKDLQLLMVAGGLASVEQVKMIETLQSGPVGGVIGGKYISDLYGIENIVTTDVGGTTFDVSLISRGVLPINREPHIDKFALAMPMIEVDSIGAGGGTIAKIDPYSGRLVLGPESAGGDPGPICYDLGGDNPTVCDADLILGYLDPDNFLGGRIKLNKQKAMDIYKTKIADPLELGLYEAAEGVKTILDKRMQGLIRSMVLGKGFEPSDYTLLAFGGGGPTHVAGYTEDIRLDDIMIFPYSACFSAFGAAVADYSHSYTRSVNTSIAHDVTEETIRGLCQPINDAWQRMEEEGLRQMEKEGYPAHGVKIVRQAMIRYRGQLNDVVVPSPVARVNSLGDWKSLLAEFDEWYGKIYSTAAKYEQAGYQIFEVGLVCIADKVKPILKQYHLSSAKPVAKAKTGARQAYFKGQFIETPVYDMDELLPGNEIDGPAIIEHTTTTVVLPPGRKLTIDKYRTMHLSNVM